MVEQFSLQSFLAPPTFRVSLIERAQLVDALRCHADRRLTLVDAPAGYGKTWLLARRHAEIQAAGGRAVWLGLGETSAAQLLAMLVHGLGRAGIDVSALETLAEQGFADVSPAAAIRLLVAALAATPTDVTLIIDDVHNLERGATRDVLNRLIADAPASVRFVCAGNNCGALPRASLRARGDLYEAGVDELRFDRDEARALLPQLTAVQLERLLASTEGWPVVMQLARLWLQAKPERMELFHAFSGRTSEVAEYLTERVLNDLSPELQAVLSDLAILDSLNAELVGAVTRSPGAWARLLAEGRLEHLLVPLDAERYWFRPHRVLLDYLRARRREQALDDRPLHALAAAWFERHDRVLDAVRHAVLADEIPRAAEMIERTGGWELVYFGGASKMRALLDSFPPGRLHEFPRVQLCRAFLAAKDGEVARALRLYEAVADSTQGNSHAGLERDRLIVGEVIFRYADRPVGPEDVRALDRAFAALDKSDDIGRATLLNMACVFALRLGDMRYALDACTRAVHEMRRLGTMLGQNYCLYHLGVAQLHAGQRREAESTLREAVALAEENFGADSGLKAIADAYLSVALNARGDTAETTARLMASLAQVETMDGWLDLYAEAYEVAIANALVRGEQAAATAIIERMADTASRRGLERLALLAEAYRARTATLVAHRAASPPATCVDLASEPAHAAFAWTPGAWRTAPWIWREHHAHGVARITASLAARRALDALPVLDDLELAARTGGRHRHQLVLAALRAAARCQLGEADGAIEAFIPQLEAAVAEDDTQFLIEFGGILLPILQKAWVWSRRSTASSRLRLVLSGAVTHLVRATAAPEAPSFLSARELEVLIELASGASNKVIARNLQMTDNTVKFHLKHVFQKLRVRHRAEALYAARARGLLP